MRQLMTLPRERLKQMGQHGRRHIAANYGMSSMAERWISLFRELLGRKGISVGLAGNIASVTEAAPVAEPHA
jgi:hypothetical protein